MKDPPQMREAGVNFFDDVFGIFEAREAYLEIRQAAAESPAAHGAPGLK